MDDELLKLAELAVRAAWNEGSGTPKSDRAGFMAAYAILRNYDEAAAVCDAQIDRWSERHRRDQLPDHGYHGMYVLLPDGTWHMAVRDYSGGTGRVHWNPQSPFDSNLHYFRGEAARSVDRAAADMQEAP